MGFDLGSILQQYLGGNAGNAGNNTPQERAVRDFDQVAPAAAAEQHTPGLIDQMGNFYAEHPTLVKALGGVALAIILGKMAEAGRR